MNFDMMINNIAYKTGKSRKEVIQMLREMSANPEIKKQLKKNRYAKRK